MFYFKSPLITRFVVLSTRLLLASRVAADTRSNIEPQPHWNRFYAITDAGLSFCGNSQLTISSSASYAHAVHNAILSSSGDCHRS